MNCPICGLSNRPYEIDCACCKVSLQDPRSAEARRREWDALSPKVREEMEQAFVRARQGFDDHREWLRRHRRTHAIIGGAVLGMCMNLGWMLLAMAGSGGMVLLLLFMALLDVGTGMACGTVLNRLGGGAYRGVGIFLGGTTVSILIHAPLVFSLPGFWLYLAVSIGPVIVTGYLMGLKLAADHSERAYLR